MFFLHLKIWEVFEYAEFLILHNPDDWNGFGRAAQALIALRRFEEAEVKIQAGLQALPKQLNLLIIATDICRSCKNYEKFLEYAEFLILHHPDDCNGYGRAAQALIAYDSKRQK